MMIADQIGFLRGFSKRGYFPAFRTDSFEQKAVDDGIELGLLRFQLGDVIFTPAGRALLAQEGK